MNSCSVCGRLARSRGILNDTALIPLSKHSKDRCQRTYDAHDGSMIRMSVGLKLCENFTRQGTKIRDASASRICGHRRKLQTAAAVPHYLWLVPTALEEYLARFVVAAWRMIIY